MLKFHPDKCKQMHIGLRECSTSKHQYTLDDKELQISNQEKDIGVIIDSSLSFDCHIATKIQKANSILGLISRTFEYKDKKSITILYKSLVRPHLEFSNQVWAPFKKKHIISLENVQRRATRIIPGLKHLEYKERLLELSLLSLAYRRLRGDVIELFKIIKGKYDTDVTEGLLHFRTSATRGHKYKLFKERARLLIRKKLVFLPSDRPME